MPKNLPPLASLRVFEAAARHLSFTKAAEELGMTQAAVSYQIKVLEERAGTNLFLRHPRRVSLSQAGARFLPPVAEAFSILSTAFASLSGVSDQVLSISCVQTFASQWLVRRIGSFQMKHPGLALRLDTSRHYISFEREDFDVAIRSGGGNWPGLTAHRLLGARFTPMLSPELMQRLGPVAAPEDLLKMPLLSPRDPWWADWFNAAGVYAISLAAQPQSDMYSQQLEAEAAMAGQGVALLTPELFTDDIQAGRLVQPFDIICESDGAYWLVYPDRRRNVPKIKSFRDWLLDNLPG